MSYHPHQQNLVLHWQWKTYLIIKCLLYLKKHACDKGKQQACKVLLAESVNRLVITLLFMVMDSQWWLQSFFSCVSDEEEGGRTDFFFLSLKCLNQLCKSVLNTWIHRKPMHYIAEWSGVSNACLLYSSRSDSLTQWGEKQTRFWLLRNI